MKKVTLKSLKELVNVFKNAKEGDIVSISVDHRFPAYRPAPVEEFIYKKISNNNWSCLSCVVDIKAEDKDLLISLFEFFMDGDDVTIKVNDTKYIPEGFRSVVMKFMFNYIDEFSKSNIDFMVNNYE